MSRKIVKIFAITLAGLLGILFIANTWKIKRGQSNALTSVEVDKIQKRINHYISSGCKRIYNEFHFNKEFTFFNLNIDDLNIKGSSFNIEISKNLILRELNIEETNRKLNMKAFMFEKTNPQKCFGMVF